MKGRKYLFSTTPVSGELSASEPCALCQFWGTHLGAVQDCCSTKAGSAQPPDFWPSQFLPNTSALCHGSGHSTSYKAFHFHTFFWGWRLATSCISQTGNVRGSWSRGCSVYKHCRLCWMGTAFTSASLGVLSRWASVIQWSIKTMNVTLLPENRRWGKSWEGHPSAWTVGLETNLLACASCPSNDPLEQGCYCGARLFMLSSLTARLHHFSVK